MQFQQIDLNDINDLSQTNGVETHRRLVGNIDLEACTQRAHAERGAVTAKGIQGIRRAVMRLLA